MACYSIPDLIELLQSERGEFIRMKVGFSPTIVIKGESHEIEGPALLKESIEEMLREIAGTREMRTFRDTGTVDVIIPGQGARFLVRAVRAFGECRLELQRI